MGKPKCEHLEGAKILEVNPDENYCQECVKMASATWVHLRKCLECGAVLCCDSSPNKHATKHFKESGHPVVISAEKDEEWAWCYVDKVIARYQS